MDVFSFFFVDVVREPRDKANAPTVFITLPFPLFSLMSHSFIDSSPTNRNKLSFISSIHIHALQTHNIIYISIHTTEKNVLVCRSPILSCSFTCAFLLRVVTLPLFVLVSSM